MLCLTDNKGLKLTVEEQCVRHVENSGKIELNELFQFSRTRNQHTISPSCLKTFSKSQVMRIKK